MHMRVLHLLTGLFASAATLAVAATPGPTGTGSAGQYLRPAHEHAAITIRKTSIDRSGQYQKELQACLSGQSHQNRETCLEEARNAQADRRSGQLGLIGEDYKANALARCGPFTGEHRAACEARVLGFGGTSGSVAGGGLLRWVETVVMPADTSNFTFAPKTLEPVVVVPGPAK